MRYGRPLAERFWEKVDRRGADECWPWTAGTTNGGYGHIRIDGRARLAHRVALFLQGGVPLDGAWMVRHDCDNPPCCNPAHLRVGTRQENSDDAVERERTSRGERRYNAILTEAAVREILDTPATYGSAGRLAEKFGVATRTIYGIRRRNGWRWLDQGER